MVMKSFEIQFLSSKMIAPQVCYLKFKLKNEEKFNFIPGQFLTFLFRSADDKIKRRSYSIANISNNSSFIEIVISYIQDGIATKFLFNACCGDTFMVTGPHGKLILRKCEKIRKLFLIGTGTGVIPYRSMLPQIKESLDNFFFKEVHVFFGIKTSKDKFYHSDFIYYADKLKNFYFHVCLSRQTKTFFPYEKIGYVQDHIIIDSLDPKCDIFYLCGNPNMVNDAFLKLKKIGFESKAIRREKYISPN